jgi:type I restriction enzyme, R subunit
MSTQSEQILEDNLVQQLIGLGYELVTIRDEGELLANLQRQLEKHNGVQLSATEFAKVLNHLDKGNFFERAKTLRDRFQLSRDNGENLYLEFLNQEHWCQNEYQVTRQVSIEGKYKNRYDVTLLINGLPLVQIELKKRGLELKEAFNQINRYQKHSYGAAHGLYQYVQLFVISNGMNTKYYTNFRDPDFKQTFFWTDRDNRKITQLEPFAEAFLEKCQVSKIISKYIVLHESNKVLMVLRPYQYFAVETLVERVKNSTKNGYIWHTTGSGKTLTSFKASQILVKLPQVHKVVFVVDRSDLDYQTAREFNHFAEGSVDSTNNTAQLVRQLGDDTKLIVTTIQKLNTAISKTSYERQLNMTMAADIRGTFGAPDQVRSSSEKRLVFIFDECHRSQFGATHKRIKKYFPSAQLFGFTGTPIFKDNAVANKLGKRTTKELFDERLHRYVITDAIRDDNVLRFSIEYVGRYVQKEGNEVALDIPVEDIDTKELLDSDQRLDKITDYLIQHHPRKTHQRAFTAIFCVSSVEVLIKYYELLRAKKQAGLHDLRVVTIFTYTANEEEKNQDGLISDPDFPTEDGAAINPHTREKLDEYVAEYNALYGTNFSTKDSQGFYNYYKNIAQRIKDREKISFQERDRVDILLVVNMFLTGFDAKKVNTLYVDKNLQYHGLVQAFSRTNRILGELKSYGNIVCFRNLKKATDEAISLFSNLDAKEVILLQPYEVYVKKFNDAYAKLQDIALTVDDVNELPSEEEVLDFVKAFRELMRLRNILTGFSDFEFEDLDMAEQEFEDYKSKYLDIHDTVKTKTEKEKTSILNEVDFELELIHRDEINVVYILKLLGKLREAEAEEQEKQRKIISDLLGGEQQLRSKRELIEKFILENLPLVQDSEEIPDAFYAFWNEEKKQALAALCTEENLDPAQLESLVEEYIFSGRVPLSDSINAALQVKPGLKERRSVMERIKEKILGFVRMFEEGV